MYKNLMNPTYLPSVDEGLTVSSGDSVFSSGFSSVLAVVVWGSVVTTGLGIAMLGKGNGRDPGALVREIGVYV